MCLVIWGKFLSLKISLGMIVHMKYLYCSPVDPGAHSSSSVNQIFGFLKGMCFFLRDLELWNLYKHSSEAGFMFARIS